MEYLYVCYDWFHVQMERWRQSCRCIIIIQSSPMLRAICQTIVNTINSVKSAFSNASAVDIKDHWSVRSSTRRIRSGIASAYTVFFICLFLLFFQRGYSSHQTCANWWLTKLVAVKSDNVLILKKLQSLPDERCITWPQLQFLDYEQKLSQCKFA